jgi:predicted Rossmann-fold nucleotide-binding protein
MGHGAQSGGVATLDRRKPANGKDVLREAGLPPGAEIQHSKFAALLGAINGAQVTPDLHEALKRLGAGSWEASKLLDIATTAHAAATQNLFGVVFFGSARKPTHFPVIDEQTGLLIDNCADVIDFVVTGHGPGVMAVPIRHARRHGIPSLGVPADIPAEHAIVGEGDEPNYILPNLHMPARKEVFLALGDVFVILPGGGGTFDEFGEIFVRAQLQRGFGGQAAYPFLKRPCMPLVILVGKIWANFMDHVVEEMIREGTIRRDELPPIKVVRQIEELGTVGGQYIHEQVTLKKLNLPAS